MSHTLSHETLKDLKKTFYEDPKNVLAQNACTRLSPFEVCTSRSRSEEIQHVFTHKIENEGKPITNQKSSGRCWIFACLNVIRVPFMKKYDLEEFEFSQSYLFFWDKIERSNYFLNVVVETAKEPADGRLVSYLLKDPVCDGGQWDMLVNLIKKHGLMPKKNFPESVSSEATHKFNDLLTSKLREFAIVLRRMVEDEASDEKIQAKIREQMNIVYRIVGICVGIPSEKFTWEYVGKTDKLYHGEGPVTAVEFYEKFVQPVFNVDDKKCLVTDPRPTSKYSQAYTVDYLGNMVGGNRVIYNNQPVESLAKFCVESIQKGEPVWFGCHVSKRFSKEFDTHDLKIHDFTLVFGTEVCISMTKAERLMYGESAMDHAMVLTAVSLDDKGEPTKWRIENSWGDNNSQGAKGYYLMTHEWFKEFVYEVVVDQSLVPKDVMDVFCQEPVRLPAWDPMGTLATN